MMIVGTIAVLAFIALVRIVLMRRHASQIRGRSEKEELVNTLAFARNRPKEVNEYDDAVASSSGAS